MTVAIKSIDFTAIPFGLLAGLFLLHGLIDSIWNAMGNPPGAFFLIFSMFGLVAGLSIAGAFLTKGWVRVALISAFIGAVIWLPLSYFTSALN